MNIYEYEYISDKEKGLRSEIVKLFAKLTVVSFEGNLFQGLTLSTN